MSQRYTAAIVGCGSIGRAHIDGYRLNDIDVVAVADPVAVAREDYMEEIGIPQGYASIEEMLEKAHPDIVSICTWHLLHHELTIVAARPEVKAIICEKPMAIGLGHADRMVEACDASDTKLVISHQRRFTPGWEKGRELVQAGAIGQPLMANINSLQGLVNCGTHAIDGVRFVLGNPQPQWVMGAVERDTDRHERAVAIEDACMGFVHFEGDIQLFVQSDLYLDKAVGGGGFEIRGTEGLIEINESQVRLLNDDGWQDVELRMKKEDIRAIGGHANGDQTRELIAWIEGDIEEHRNSGRTARVTVEIMMALYESARLHQVIHLPLEEKEYPLDLMIAEELLPVREPGWYDIRGFLRRDNVDQEAYKKLRAEGVDHFPALRKLHEEMGENFDSGN